MKKKYWVIPAAMLLLLGIYIGSRGSKSSDSAEKMELSMRCKNFIRRLNRREYDSCLGLMTDEFKSEMSGERLRAAFDPVLNELGDFSHFRSFSLSTDNLPDGAAIAGKVRAVYENGSAMFTVLLSPELRVDGLQVK